MKYFLVIFCCLSGMFAQGQVKDVDITKMDEKELAGKFLVDVRTPEEYGEGHIQGALNLDYSNPDFIGQWEGIDKETPVYLYCRTGKRSAKASKTLDSLGFKEVYNLKGGYQALEKARKK
ncbi:rhodanese-like domain-containing protein [Sinomicrobium pectinilyticum]|uniref:Rhodanese-like domain-containing protein n=1 Tax=Sinomicrobium pectinilyticum TaxID=1084421 RepID=A0A3N0EAR3_SINP1|nr:rhodanese-like domain-containing protein [Sinomicrobium pectinilyticum]RNL84898.1 rhodanese-like domain-containing protein [Sinomicrobium pectinilyticum]